MFISAALPGQLAVLSLAVLVGGAAAVLPGPRRTGSRTRTADPADGPEETASSFDGWSVTLLPLLALTIMPQFPATVRQAAAVGAVTAAMGLTSTRPDLRSLRIESRLALRLAAGAILWLTGTRLAPTGRTGIDLTLTLVWTATAITAFDLRDEPHRSTLVSGLVSIGMLTVITLLDGRPLVALLASLSAGLTLGWIRDDTSRDSSRAVRRLLVPSGPALGTLIAVLGILKSRGEPSTVALFLPLLILAVPLLDAAVTTLGRLSEGMSPLVSRDDLLVHRLRSAGFAGRMSALLLISTAILHGGAAALLTLYSEDAAIPIFALIAALDVGLLVLLLRTDPMPRSNLRATNLRVPDDSIDPDAEVDVRHLPLRTSGLLRPGIWIRRSHLVWVRRGTEIPPHLMRTRIVRYGRDSDALRRLWARLLSRTIHRRARVTLHDAERARFDVIVRSKDGSRTVCVDTSSRTIVHRANGFTLSDDQVSAHRTTFAHLRGPRLLAHDPEGGFSEELLWGHHLLDLDDATRLGALSALLLDVITLTERTSQPASELFRQEVRRTRGQELPERFRTVRAPSTTSLDNVVMTGHQQLAWVDVFPIVECAFHLPWFGVAVRIADISETVTEAFEQGVFDRGMATLLRLGGACDGDPDDPLALMRGLPWTVSPPAGSHPRSSPPRDA